MSKADWIRLAGEVQNETGCGLVAGVASVRAVLRAIREPSAEMVRSAQMAPPDIIREADGITSDRARWRAMIDKLLEE